MARENILLERNKPITTPAFAREADWVNYTGDTIMYCIFEAGDTEDEWPTDDDDVRFIGLPWPHECAIPTKPGERLHVLARQHENGRIEGHEAAP